MKKLIIFIVKEKIGTREYEFLSTTKYFYRKNLLDRDLIVKNSNELRFVNRDNENIEIEGSQVYFPFVKDENTNTLLLYEPLLDNSNESITIERILKNNTDYLNGKLKDDRQFPPIEQFIKDLEKAIKQGTELYEKAPKIKSVIYDAYFDNTPIPPEKGGKVYAMEDFSACGWVCIRVVDQKFVNYLKKVAKSFNNLKIAKNYKAGHSVFIDKYYYSNGLMHRLEEFYKPIEKLFKKYSDKLSIYSQLD